MKPCDEYTIEHSFWHELGHVMQYYSTCATDETSVQTFASFMMEHMVDPKVENLIE